jgi:TonB family protein
MKIRIFITIILVAFAGLVAQQKEGAKLMKADESGFIQVDKVPALVSALKPVYPNSAKLAGMEGTVYLKLLIDEKGKVAKAKVEQGVKNILDNAALAAAKKAIFSPALINNKPVKVWVVLPIAFKLDIEKKEKEITKKIESDGNDEPDMNTFVSVEKLPEMIKAAKPAYPEIAKRAGITGKVFVKVLVDKDGNPKKAFIIKSENEIFNQSSIDAAMKSTFTPAMQGGKAISVWIVLPYRFALDGKLKGESDLRDSIEDAKKQFEFTLKFWDNPKWRKESGNLPDVECEKIDGKVSYGDESVLYKIWKTENKYDFKYLFMARKADKIYRTDALNIIDIQKYIDELKANENIPANNKEGQK